MSQTFFWRAVLIVVLCVALAAPARANFDTLGDEIVAGIVLVSVGIGVLVVFLVVHHKNSKSSISGCVAAGTTGMSLTDEKDKRTWVISGNPVGLKAGDRMTLEGKRRKTGGVWVFDAHSVTQDLGACRP